MDIRFPFATITRAPESETGAGGDAAAGGEGGDPGVDAGAGAGGAGAGGGAAAASAKWWEGAGLTDDQRTQITALGLTTDDPVKAVAKLADMERAAKQKLGRPADQLIDRPAEGQDVGEWLRAHGEVFGIPESAEGYEVARPEGWPKDAQWNGDLEGKARELGHKHGMSGAALNDFVGLYAGEVQRLMGDASDQLAASNTEMQAALQKDWGDQYGAKVALAQQAVSAVSEAAGLTADDIAAISAAMKPKVGDAGIVKLFAAVGEMMGEDSFVGGAAGGLATTPAEARAKLQELRSPEGAYAKAVASQNRAELKRLAPEIERLSKIAAG